MLFFYFWPWLRVRFTQPALVLFPFAVRRPDKQCFASLDWWLERLFVPLFDLCIYSRVSANMCSPEYSIIADSLTPK
jgi:hypothetical protein